MELYLDNIGKVCDSTVIVDGLTVITGENNSGKTTIGKTLYSITSAVENLQQNAFFDRRNFTMHAIIRILSRLELRRPFRTERFEIDNNIGITKIDSIFDLASLKQLESIEGILSVIDEKIKKLNNCSEEDIYESLGEGDTKSQAMKKRLVDNFMKKRTEVVKSLDEIKKSIQTDLELVEYANVKIIKTLRNEFYNQIKGVNNESKESKIRLSHEGEEYYNIKLHDNELSGKDEIFLLQAFDLSLFVDDVFVVDDMIYGRRIKFPNNPFVLNEDDISYKAFLDTLPRILHKEKLLSKLVMNSNLFEENLYKAKTEEIIKCMKEAGPGQMNFVKGRYVIDELDVRNLAMGSKMFLIIKTLIEKGYCGSKTLLVLDEPETHLHPEWQNILAETIVSLVKNLETKVILTTHNPNFLLAIDFFSKEHEIQNITHFYKTILIDEGKKAKLELADENINEIYAKMTKPFLELETMMDYTSEYNENLDEKL
jgi:predicted ATPase